MRGARPVLIPCLPLVLLVVLAACAPRRPFVGNREEGGGVVCVLDPRQAYLPPGLLHRAGSMQDCMDRGFHVEVMLELGEPPLRRLSRSEEAYRCTMLQDFREGFPVLVRLQHSFWGIEAFGLRPGRGPGGYERRRRRLTREEWDAFTERLRELDVWSIPRSAGTESNGIVYLHPRKYWLEGVREGRLQAKGGYRGADEKTHAGLFQLCEEMVGLMGFMSLDTPSLRPSPSRSAR